MRISTTDKERLGSLIDEHGIAYVARAIGIASTTLRTASVGANSHPETVAKIKAMLGDGMDVVKSAVSERPRKSMFSKLESRLSELAEEIRQLRAEISVQKTRYINQAELARMLGIKPSALSMRLSRGKSELAALSSTIDGKRVWRVDQIESIISGQP